MSISTTSLPAKPFPVLGHIARDVSRDINLVFYLLTIALTVLVLAGFVGKAIPPRAGGEPYVKER